MSTALSYCRFHCGSQSVYVSTALSCCRFHCGSQSVYVTTALSCCRFHCGSQSVYVSTDLSCCRFHHGPQSVYVCLCIFFVVMSCCRSYSIMDFSQSVHVCLCILLWGCHVVDFIFHLGLQPVCLCMPVYIFVGMAYCGIKGRQLIFRFCCPNYACTAVAVV